MKYIIVIILALVLNSCQRDIMVDISGATTGINGVVVRILSEDYKLEFAKDTIRSNRFNFKINLPKSGFYLIDFTGKYENNKTLSGWSHDAKIYAENNKYYQFKANSELDILRNKYFIKSNLKTQQKLAEFNKFYYERFWTIDSCIKEKKKLALRLFDDQKIKDYDKLWLEALSEENYLHEVFPIKFVKEYAIKNPHTFISAYELIKVNDLQENYQTYLKIYDHLDETVKNNYYGIIFKQKLDAIKTIAYGNDLPNINGKDLNGNYFNYDYHKQKLILVDFWASWCIPCRKSNVELLALYNKYHKQGFDIISVSFDNNYDSWKKAILKDDLIWRNHYCDLKKINESVNSIRFDINSIPQNYLVNNEGKIICRNIDIDDLKSRLDSMK